MKRRPAARIALSLSTLRRLTGSQLHRVDGGEDVNETNWVVPPTQFPACGSKPDDDGGTKPASEKCGEVITVLPDQKV